MDGLKKVLNPAMLGFIVGIFWLLTGVKVPLALVNFSTYIGSLTTPLSMFIIGITVYFLGLRTLKLNKAIVGVLMGRFIISPLIIILITRVITIPDIMVKVFSFSRLCRFRIRCRFWLGCTMRMLSLRRRRWAIPCCPIWLSCRFCSLSCS